jgi:hypothetical protein
VNLSWLVARAQGAAANRRKLQLDDGMTQLKSAMPVRANREICAL